MNCVWLVPIGSVPQDLLEFVCAHLPSQLPAPCELLPTQPVPAYAFNAERQQYASTEILARLAASVTPFAWRVLGVTSLDLYIPILTFVFGEAQLDGNCAVVSSHRLRQEVYGLPPDQKLLQERLLKEAVHELGHTSGLAHCPDRNCVMASSHSVEWIDVKTASFCSTCRAALLSSVRPTRVTNHCDSIR